MGTELRVDLTSLGEAATALGRIATEFDDADTNSQACTASIGNKNETHNLRHEVESFANSWKTRRAEIKEDVAYLAEVAQAVAQALTDQDNDLATNLTSGGSKGANTTPSSAPRAV